MLETKKNIAIFASGGGSNAEEIITHFANSEKGQIALIVTNNPKAFVINRAEKHGIPYYLHQNEDLENGNLEKILQDSAIDFIVLAGYLKKITPSLVALYPKKIVNIHPALLPKFGGKGMYGMNVHKAVVEAKERRSGITIHYVDENYDEGSIIEQHQCLLNTHNMTPESVQSDVLELEHRYFSKCIERLL
jgi:phosphoribosylglycinamide formyltransferase-1